MKTYVGLHNIHSNVGHTIIDNSS